MIKCSLWCRLSIACLCCLLLWSMAANFLCFLCFDKTQYHILQQTGFNSILVEMIVKVRVPGGYLALCSFFRISNSCLNYTCIFPNKELSKIITLMIILKKSETKTLKPHYRELFISEICCKHYSKPM